MKKILFILTLISVLLCCNGTLFAKEKDLALIMESKYFYMYGYKNFHIQDFLSRLKFDYSVRIENLLDDAKNEPKDMLVKTMDALYLEVSDILGMHIYSLQGNLNCYSSQDALSVAFRRYFNQDFSGRSFYLHEKKDIYIIARCNIGYIRTRSGAHDNISLFCCSAEP